MGSMLVHSKGFQLELVASLARVLLGEAYEQIHISEQPSFLCNMCVI